MLVVINVVAIGVMGYLGGVFARQGGRHALAGVILPAYFGLITSVSRDTAEPLSAACLLGGLLAIRARRPLLAGLLLAYGVLTRESVLVAVAAVAIVEVVRAIRRRRPVRPGRDALALFAIAALASWRSTNAPLHERLALVFYLIEVCAVSPSTWYSLDADLRSFVEVYLLAAIILLGTPRRRIRYWLLPAFEVLLIPAIVVVTQRRLVGSLPIRGFTSRSRCTWSR